MTSIGSVIVPIETPPSRRTHKRAPLADRFWAKVARRGPDDCWLWTGSGYGKEYGGFMIAGLGCIGAHRVAYALTHGVPPGRIWVLHRCDTPRCCNPAHLFLGNHEANMADMAGKGRSVAKLSPAEVLAARALYKHYGWTVTALAQRFNVSKTIISNLLHDRSYRHVGRDLTLKELKV